MTQHKQASIKINFIMNFILTVSSFIFPIITFPYISRTLLPLGTGRIAFATSVASYATMLGMVGIPTYGIRAVARVRNQQRELNKTVQEIFFFNAIATLGALALYLVSIALVPRFAEDKTLFLINGVGIVFNLFGMEWLYRGLEQYRYITVRSIAFKCLSLVLMFLLVHSTSDYLIYGGILVFATVGANVLNFIHARHYISFKLEPNLEIWRHFFPALQFFLMAVATTIYTSLDSVMLGMMIGKEAVGYYDAAIKIKNILISLVTALGGVLLPRLSHYIQTEQHEAFKRVTRKAFAFVCFASIPLSTYFIVMAEPAILFLSKEQFLPSVFPMQLVMPTIVLIGLSNLLGIQILLPLGKERVVLSSVCWGAVLNFALNLVLIPSWGVAGAAFSTLLAELLVTIYQAWYLRDQLREMVVLADLGKIGLATVLATLSTFLFRHWISPFWTLALSASVFGLIYLAILWFSREQFVSYLGQMALGFLKRRKV